ncbi:MAG: hypothetical protein QXU09_01560 [Thermoproteota archaeon]
MSVKVEGVIDLPHVDLRDMVSIYELMHFALEQDLWEELKDWSISLTEDKVVFTHKSRSWSYVEVHKDGTVVWDKHYKETTSFKDKLISFISEYYPMFKKALSIASKYNAKMSYDKERERIILEVQDA